MGGQEELPKKNQRLLNRFIKEYIFTLQFRVDR
jgi:hypothetical protein